SVPFSRNMRDSFLSLLATDGHRVGDAFRHQESASLAKKEADAEHIQRQVATNQGRINQSEREIQSIRKGSPAMGVVSLICCALCSAAEYVLNHAVLPWLLSVPPNSVLGIALSLAPATAPIVLDRVIVALFDIDDSWEAIKEALKPRS